MRKMIKSAFTRRFAAGFALGALALVGTQLAAPSASAHCATEIVSSH
jgi:hypothetical protein